VKQGVRERMAHGMGKWAARRLEKRVRQQLASYDQQPDVKWRWFRADVPARTQNFRSLIQVNFYRSSRR
jgi:hypothetical protein